MYRNSKKHTSTRNRTATQLNGNVPSNLNRQLRVLVCFVDSPQPAKRRELTNYASIHTGIKVCTSVPRAGMKPRKGVCRAPRIRNTGVLDWYDTQGICGLQNPKSNRAQKSKVDPNSEPETASVPSESLRISNQQRVHIPPTVQSTNP